MLPRRSPNHRPLRVQSEGTQLSQGRESSVWGRSRVDAESTLGRRGFWRLEVAVEFAFSDAVSFREACRGTHHRRHLVNEESISPSSSGWSSSSSRPRKSGVRPIHDAYDWDSRGLEYTEMATDWSEIPRVDNLMLDNLEMETCGQRRLFAVPGFFQWSQDRGYPRAQGPSAEVVPITDMSIISQ